jgi:hypothetical protein
VTTLDQLRHLHIDPDRKRKFLQPFIDADAVLDEATRLRRELASPVDEDDPQRSTAGKLRLLRRADEVTTQLRLMADGIIAAGLALGGKPGAQLEDAYKSLEWALAEAFPGDGSTGNRQKLDTILADGLTPTVDTDYRRWQPLHWVIEAPDVIVERGGFDAIIGNPPFLGGQKLTGALGTNIRDWLVNVLAAGTKGSADQVAYFFLRAESLLSSRGTIGLIATNTIGQGDTREVGLDQMVDAGFTITRAIQSRSWPASTVNLEFAAVWGGLGQVADDVPRISDDKPVKRITTLLDPGGRVEGNPARLTDNSGIAFIGCYVLGMGFVLEPAEAQAWIAEQQRNAEVLFPYLHGEDLNQRSDCSASRWVIDFNERSLDEAGRYPRALQRVRQTVKPERDRLDGRNPTATDRARSWWKFGRRSPAMRDAIAGLDEVLVIALVSKTAMPARVPTGQVFAHRLAVFATDSYADQAVLSSSVHQAWAIKYSSTMRTDVNYSPSDAFETFPRPHATGRLEQVGRTVDVERRVIMLRRDLGLTKLYNLVNDPQITDAFDPDVARMRAIHIELDQAVAEAYGWSDVQLKHGFHTYRQMERFTISLAARVEILDRLLEENHRRAGILNEGASGEQGDLFS